MTTANELWAILHGVIPAPPAEGEPSVYSASMRRAASFAASRSSGNVATRGGATIVDGIAVVGLYGVLAPSVPSWMGGTSNVEAAATIRHLADQDEVRGIFLHIASPGGAVDGTTELADAVREAAEVLPVVAAIEGTGASGAYWVASQAREVYAERGAMVGSIGVYHAVIDTSEALTRKGVKVTAVKTAPAKGIGFPGTVVADEHIAEIQRMVDDVFDVFKADVSRRRKLRGPNLDRVADARVHLAPQAETLGLIDGVKRADEVFAELSASAPVRGREAADRYRTLVVKEAVRRFGASETAVPVSVFRHVAAEHVAADHPDLAREYERYISKTGGEANVVRKPEPEEAIDYRTAYQRSLGHR